MPWRQRSKPGRTSETALPATDTMTDAPEKTNRLPPLFRIEAEEDLRRIPFVDGMALVEVPARLLDRLSLKHGLRGPSQRLKALETSIRSKGFQPLEPIEIRIGKKGRWLVVNGGHRLTAARKVMGEFWSNLFGPKVETLYFVLFADELSWSKAVDARPDGFLPAVEDRITAAERRAEWDVAHQNMREND